MARADLPCDHTNAQIPYIQKSILLQSLAALMSFLKPQRHSAICFPVQIPCSPKEKALSTKEKTQLTTNCTKYLCHRWSTPQSRLHHFRSPITIGSQFQSRVCQTKSSRITSRSFSLIPITSPAAQPRPPRHHHHLKHIQI